MSRPMVPGKHKDNYHAYEDPEDDESDDPPVKLECPAHEAPLSESARWIGTNGLACTEILSLSHLIRQFANTAPCAITIRSPRTLRHIECLKQPWIEDGFDCSSGFDGLVVEILQIGSIVPIELKDTVSELFGCCEIVESNRRVVGGQETGIILGSIQDRYDPNGVRSFNLLRHVVVAVAVLNCKIKLVPRYDLAICEQYSIFVERKGRCVGHKKER